MIQKIKDPLYKNSIFLMLSSITGAGSGFIFWFLAARIYPAEAVGLSSAMVSAMRLISLFSLLGLNTAIIRYIPEREDKLSLINSSMITVGLTSIILSITFIFTVDLIAPSLKILKNTIISLLFIVFTLMLSLSDFIGQGVFVAFRKAEYTFIQSTASFLRIVILPLLITLGAIGIYISFGIGIVIASILGFILTFKIILYKFKFSKAVKDLIGYAFGVYIARIFESLPNLLLPILVLEVLGAEMNAYFFIAWNIMFFTTMIARNTGISLLAEGSYKPTELRIKVVGSLKFVYLLLFLAVIGIYTFGDQILGFFGEEYTKNALGVLRILLIGCIPYSFNVIYASAMMVVKNLKRVIAIYGGIAMVTIVIGYIFMLKFGLVGVGYAWILANILVLFSIILKILKFN